jgi:hypothetical protein
LNHLLECAWPLDIALLGLCQTYPPLGFSALPSTEWYQSIM